MFLKHTHKHKCAPYYKPKIWLKVVPKVNRVYTEEFLCVVQDRVVACYNSLYIRVRVLHLKSTPKPETKPSQEEEEQRKKAHTFTVPCSSLKRRERLAASISGVGLSRICLHHCKGLRDFSGEGKTFDEPIYNLKKKREKSTL